MRSFVGVLLILMTILGAKAQTNTDSLPLSNEILDSLYIHEVEKRKSLPRFCMPNRFILT